MPLVDQPFARPIDAQATDILDLAPVTGYEPAPGMSWWPERAALRLATIAGLTAWLAFCARVIWLCWF